MPEVRFANADDARREAAVEMFKRHVRAARITTNYDADIEHMEYAVLAFADEWATEVPSSEVERLRLAANSARVLIERHRATRGSNDLLSTALRELDDALTAPPQHFRSQGENA